MWHGNASRNRCKDHFGAAPDHGSIEFKSGQEDHRSLYVINGNYFRPRLSSKDIFSTLENNDGIHILKTEHRMGADSFLDELESHDVLAICQVEVI